MSRLRALRLLFLLRFDMITPDRARRRAGLPPFLPNWTCPSCDDGADDCPCECLDIVYADIEDLKKELNAVAFPS